MQDGLAPASPSLEEPVPPTKGQLGPELPFPWGKPEGISLLDHSPREFPITLAKGRSALT